VRHLSYFQAAFRKRNAAIRSASIRNTSHFHMGQIPEDRLPRSRSFGPCQSKLGTMPPGQPKGDLKVVWFFLAFSENFLLLLAPSEIFL
jgi:hypothetical protein